MISSNMTESLGKLSYHVSSLVIPRCLSETAGFDRNSFLHSTAQWHKALSSKQNKWKAIFFPTWSWEEEGKDRNGKLANTLGKEANAFFWVKII